jgi:hypothetical protein
LSRLPGKYFPSGTILLALFSPGLFTKPSPKGAQRDARAAGPAFVKIKVCYLKPPRGKPRGMRSLMRFNKIRTGGSVNDGAFRFAKARLRDKEGIFCQSFDVERPKGWRNGSQEFTHNCPKPTVAWLQYSTKRKHL